MHTNDGAFWLHGWPSLGLIARVVKDFAHFSRSCFHTGDVRQVAQVEISTGINLSDNWLSVRLTYQESSINPLVNRDRLRLTKSCGREDRER